MKPAVLKIEPTLVETFEGDSLNENLWNVWGKQYDGYVGYDWGVIRADQVKQENGELVISMDKRAEPKTFKNDTGKKVRTHDVGWVDTERNFSFVHGAIEVVSNHPAAPLISAGVWCGEWMRPDGAVTEGEIDFGESFGDLGLNAKATVSEAERYKATVHYDYKGNNIGKLSPWSPVPLSEGYHRYGVYKSPEEIIFYFDREEIFRVTRAQDPAKWDKAFPEDVPFHLRLCVQAGSNWAGLPTENTPDHVEYRVQSVTGWKFDK